MLPSSDFLLEARELGLLGPGPVEIHHRHSEGFVDSLNWVWQSPDRSFDLDFIPGPKGETTRLLDLGSGGGVPGMIVAELWPAARVSLLESSKKRCALLNGWLDRTGWGSRVTVLCGRAEELGRDPQLRGQFDAVLARSFGRPSLTSECGAPFLRVNGLLVVSDPPTGSRWPAEALNVLGLEPLETVSDPFHFTIIRQREACPDRYPRRTGIPAKRPLF